MLIWLMDKKQNHLRPTGCHRHCQGPDFLWVRRGRQGLGHLPTDEGTWQPDQLTNKLTTLNSRQWSCIFLEDYHWVGEQTKVHIEDRKYITKFISHCWHVPSLGVIILTSLAVNSQARGNVLSVNAYYKQTRLNVISVAVPLLMESNHLSQSLASSWLVARIF